MYSNQKSSFFKNSKTSVLPLSAVDDLTVLFFSLLIYNDFLRTETFPVHSKIFIPQKDPAKPVQQWWYRLQRRP